MTICIAISASDNQGLESAVSQHFGRCAYFVIAEIEDNLITSANAIDNPYANSHGPGQVPELIHRYGASVMLAGGMGRRAVGFFEQYGIEVATGATGTVRQAIEDYLAGKLSGAQPCAQSERHHEHG